MIISISALIITFILIYALSLTQYAVPALLGWLISFANALAGSIVLFRAFRKGGKGFFNTVLLSLVVRMFAMCGFIFILIYFFKIEKFSLAVSMFFFYFLFLILEINFLNKNREIKQAG